MPDAIKNGHCFFLILRTVTHAIWWSLESLMAMEISLWTLNESTKIE